MQTLGMLRGSTKTHVTYYSWKRNSNEIMRDAYLFSLIDEDAKNIEPINFECHRGTFHFDGQPKYQLKHGPNSNGLVVAKDVRYLAQKWCVSFPTFL